MVHFLLPFVGDSAESLALTFLLLFSLSLGFGLFLLEVLVLLLAQ